MSTESITSSPVLELKNDVLRVKTMSNRKRRSIKVSSNIIPAESAITGLNATKKGIEKQVYNARHITKDLNEHEINVFNG